MIIVGITFLVFLFIECAYIYYYSRWKHLWALESRIPPYKVTHDVHEGVKVLLIGDSWAGIHHETGMDACLNDLLESETKKPAVVTSKGKGGERIKGIYHLMFASDGYGTRTLLTEAPDYCVIFAGINDAAANLGTRQYCYYYRLILDFLLVNHIRPVVVEIPDVNIWQIYGKKPVRDLMSDFVKSRMTECRMYQFTKYREALYFMLLRENLMEKIVYVPMTDWNADSPNIDKSIFLDDQIHLNRQGYEKLDACIAKAIAKDLQ